MFRGHPAESPAFRRPVRAAAGSIHASALGSSLEPAAPAARAHGGWLGSFILVCSCDWWWRSWVRQSRCGFLKLRVFTEQPRTPQMNSLPFALPVDPRCYGARAGHLQLGAGCGRRLNKRMPECAATKGQVRARVSAASMATMVGFSCKDNNKARVAACVFTG